MDLAHRRGSLGLRSVGSGCPVRCQVLSASRPQEPAVIGNVVNVPSYVSMTPSGNNSYVWAASTTDSRGLQMANNLSSRIAACWYTSGSFTVDLTITDADTHQLAIYIVDWDNYFGRSERADILDANGNLLNSQSVASFVGGQYLVWNVTGHVVLRITNLNSSDNAVVSGLFFDPAGAVTAPVATGAATFVTFPLRSASRSPPPRRPKFAAISMGLPHGATREVRTIYT